MQEKYDNNTTPTTSAELDPDFRPFTDDFIFSLVMRDPALCRELLALALPEEDFGEIKIMKSQNPLIDEPADGAAEAHIMMPANRKYSSMITALPPRIPF